MSSKKEKLLGKILVDNKVITNEELQEALLIQEGNPLRLGQILIKKGRATETDILNALGEHYGIPFQSFLDFDAPGEITEKIPVNFLNKNMIVPFKIKDDILYIGVADALNIQPLDDLKMLFPSLHFEPVLTVESEILRVIHDNYDLAQSQSTDQVIEDLAESDFEILTTHVSETEDIMDMANDAPIIRLVNTIIRNAVTDRASDIHFEPYEKDIAVRFRIDGILYQMFSPPKKYQNAIISRIKIMSNLNITENRLPQDGRIQLKIGGKDIDIRVSVFPTYFGERIVLRLLYKSDMNFELESIGFSSRNLTQFDGLISKTHGIILVTGPTGSGKSTTLYSVLSKLNEPDVNILTVEDPIEYQLKGIGQMQINEKISLTFASGLKSILRQDPDIVMIGEIRDYETAEIAIQSALTGHRVFSTLHTNDAASGFTRLLEMGIEPYLIASSINAFLAQRLVRKICPHCKTSYKPDKKLLAELKLRQTELKNGKLYKGKGCDKCLNTGYIGRVGIFELLPISTEIRELVLTHADSNQIKSQAKAAGMLTLRNDGLNKVIEGMTTVEEVLRVC